MSFLFLVFFFGFLLGAGYTCVTFQTANMVALVLEVILDRVTFLDLEGEGWGFPPVLLGCHGRCFFPTVVVVALMILKLGSPDCHFILGVVFLQHFKGWLLIDTRPAWKGSAIGRHDTCELWSCDSAVWGTAFEVNSQGGCHEFWGWEPPILVEQCLIMRSYYRCHYMLLSLDSGQHSKAAFVRMISYVIYTDATISLSCLVSNRV